MVKSKTQKVRFHRGDKRPGNTLGKTKLSYTVDMVKEGRKILWHVVEQPTNNVVGKYFFEDELSTMAEDIEDEISELEDEIKRGVWD